ncbi:4Fe-4S binding domain protein [Perkinsela sp. CCAP 1560/4]|nr:4Fe-4S binding domain protein [Perkinsela sp. CCAP 1560/4]|eukprot:KNH06551.1 4Fe-4S binding domain protein [Perkinsela sp. CCAP 1560/4]
MNAIAPGEDPLLSEMEDLLQLVRNVTQTKVKSFHRIPAHIYESMFRAIMPESSVSIQTLDDVVSALRNELREYCPPVLFPDADEPTTHTDFTFAHHIQLLAWLKEVAATSHLRFNVVPDEQLRELKLDEPAADSVPPTPEKNSSRIRPRQSSATESTLAAIEGEIEARKKRAAKLDACIDGVKRIIQAESGSKRRLELRKYLKNVL